MKAWAEAARGSRQTISPGFVASKIFPGNPCKDYSVSSKFLTSKSFTTKRFVFNSNVLTLLKVQPVACSSSSRAPTRMEATTTVIWKAAAKAASTVRSFSPQLERKERITKF
ncbi:vinorine synthase-like protein, partial [Tanacetum coccineum]